MSAGIVDKVNLWLDEPPSVLAYEIAAAIVMIGVILGLLMR